MIRVSGLYLCVDAGGTKTAVVVADENGIVLSRGKAGPANMSEVGVETAANAIISAINLAVALLPEKQGLVQFGGAWVGISGCDTPNDIVTMSRYLNKLMPSCSMTIMNDALLLSAPLVLRSEPHIHSQPWSLAVIAGTGSIVQALALGEQGKPISIAKRGGYGHLFGDSGSAYDLGLTAIKTVTETYDMGLEGKGEQGLAVALCKEWGVSGTSELPGKAHELSEDMPPVASSDCRKRKIASLSPLVLSLSSRCPQAALIVRRVAKALASDIAVVVDQVRLAGYVSTPGLVVAGGLGTRNEYISVLLQELSELGIRPGWLETVVDVAELGARALARTESQMATCT